MNQKEFHILSTMLAGSMLGCDLLESLRVNTGDISAPGFYKLMGRLKSNGYVSRENEYVKIDGRRFRRHRYRITPDGWNEFYMVGEFYATRVGR